MKTRFAPSPTGYLHKGHIWSALCVTAAAKERNASIHLRIEDHDSLRCSKHFIDEIKKDLQWIGFKWQSESLQSERNEIYEKHFETLQKKGLLYELYKTNKPKIMFKNPDGEDFAVKDALGQWTYQFTVVADDFEENIDLIVRGEDLKDSVDKQVTLAKILGRNETPLFIHHSLIYDSNRKKLSKRDGSDGICKERENGVSPMKILSEICGKMLPGKNIPSEISWDEAVDKVISVLFQAAKNTIIALATPPGLSAIAALRASGPAVTSICKAVLPEFKMQPRTASLVNHLIAIYFPAPNSYTGEDVLELFPHGNPFIVRKLIEEICKVPGVRLAERGEFTQRAFLNGKMDLTQAEAVGDLLHASDSKSLSNAHRLLSGEISCEIKTLAQSIKEASALMELEVDFAEDDTATGAAPHGYPINCDILHSLRKLKKRFKILQSEPPRVALFGAPNAGKSSLINALVREDRLLVSEIPGTTRDFVEVLLNLPSGDILLIDTAGLASKAQSEIDSLAMQKSKEVLEKANLKILVIDASTPLPAEFETWRTAANITAWTHIDISCQSYNPENSDFRIASPKNEGIKELIEALDNILFPKTEEQEDAWITNERQIACINKAEECVSKALELPVELAAFEMREARVALCSLTGEISDENVLDSIFNSYCIGK
ncbi:MAG: tRNA uridine-5-carboxymethylaminomethyl(34) synthesis GTPase MnmE [Fibromonadaceae bacterium]|jgi:tRNA modification GTPase|nr:tRNA uridine-5-carboxymethylaminomethyl(34) synthesis GTPase MnmE [Fibromonadaceae bacterium]